MHFIKKIFYAQEHIGAHQMCIKRLKCLAKLTGVYMKLPGQGSNTGRRD